MTHDQYGGAGQQICHRTHGFHQNGPFFRVTQERFVFNGFLGFLAFPDFIAQVVDHGVLKFVVSLGHGGHIETLHNRIAVFEAVSETAGGGIADDIVKLHPQVFKEDVDLFCQVDVNGGRRDDGMAVSHGGRPDSFVIFFFDRSQCKVGSLAFFRNFFQYFLVLFHCRSTPHDQGNVDGVEYAFHRFRRIFRTVVPVVGVRAF